MKQKKASGLKRIQTGSQESKNSSKSGIRSLFKHPANLFQPSTESSGVFTKNYKTIRYR